jgi:hypothetical protein
VPLPVSADVTIEKVTCLNPNCYRLSNKTAEIMCSSLMQLCRLAQPGFILAEGRERLDGKGGARNEQADISRVHCRVVFGPQLTLLHQSSSRLVWLAQRRADRAGSATQLPAGQAGNVFDRGSKAAATHAMQTELLLELH